MKTKTTSVKDFIAANMHKKIGLVSSSMATYGAETLAGQAPCFPYPANQNNFNSYK
jgi:hypothetical protein